MIARQEGPFGTNWAFATRCKSGSAGPLIPTSPDRFIHAGKIDGCIRSPQPSGPFRHHMVAGICSSMEWDFNVVQLPAVQPGLPRLLGRLGFMGVWGFFRKTLVPVSMATIYTRVPYCGERDDPGGHSGYGLGKILAWAVHSVQFRQYRSGGPPERRLGKGRGTDAFNSLSNILGCNIQFYLLGSPYKRRR